MFRPARCSLYLLCSQERERKNLFLFFFPFHCNTPNWCQRLVWWCGENNSHIGIGILKLYIYKYIHTHTVIAQPYHMGGLNELAKRKNWKDRIRQPTVARQGRESKPGVEQTPEKGADRLGSCPGLLPSVHKGSLLTWALCWHSFLSYNFLNRHKSRVSYIMTPSLPASIFVHLELI